MGYKLFWYCIGKGWAINFHSRIALAKHGLKIPVVLANAELKKIILYCIGKR